MNCDECKEKLSLYIDGMLSEEEEKAIVAHLDLCETCHEEYKTLTGIISLLKSSKEVELPKGFHENLIRRMKQEQKVRPIKTKRFKWEYPAGLVATLLVGFMAFGGHFTGNKSSATSEAPMTAYSMPESTEESAAEDMARGIEKQAAPAEAAPSVVSNEASSGIQEEEKSLKSAALDGQADSVVWEATIKDKPAFLKAIEEYLKAQQLTYTEEEGYLLITSTGDYTALWEWIQGQTEVKQIIITHDTGSDLKLIYHE